MRLLLDGLALFAVLAAVAYLWRRRAGGCATARRGASGRISVAALRATARRARGDD
jgi:hypothetical protein